MLRNAPEQIQQCQAYAVKDAVTAREQLDRAAYTVREIVERIRTRHERHQWLVGMAAVLCHRRHTPWCRLRAPLLVTMATGSVRKTSLTAARRQHHERQRTPYELDPALPEQGPLHWQLAAVEEVSPGKAAAEPEEAVQTRAHRHQGRGDRCERAAQAVTALGADVAFEYRTRGKSWKSTRTTCMSRTAKAIPVRARRR
jgi:hypothetical protein